MHTNIQVSSYILLVVTFVWNKNNYKKVNIPIHTSTTHACPPMKNKSALHCRITSTSTYASWNKAITCKLTVNMKYGEFFL